MFAAENAERAEKRFELPMDTDGRGEREKS